MGYVASPLWMAQLLVGIVLVLQSTYIRPEYFTQDFSLFPAWPRFDAQRALDLFGVTMAVLLAPKALRPAHRAVPARNPARPRAARSASSCRRIVEIIMSSLLAPIMMLIQSGSVIQILLGRDTGWSPQRRDDGSIPFRDIVRRHRSHVALGFVTLVAGALDLALARRLDVADHRRPDPGDLSVLGQRPAVDRPVPQAPRPAARPRRRPPRRRSRRGPTRWRSNSRGPATTARTASRPSMPSRELRELHEAYLPPPPPRRRGEVDHRPRHGRGQALRCRVRSKRPRNG